MFDSRSLFLPLIATFLFVAGGCEDQQQAKEKLRKTATAVKKAAKTAQDVAANVVLAPAKAEQLGDRMAAEVTAKYETVDGPVADYVERLGRQLVEAADHRPKGIRYDFHVIRDDTINAFAIPGGHVFVTTELLKAADNESELVAVLSHEVAHVVERHVAERMTAAYGVKALEKIALDEEAGRLERMVAQIVSEGVLLKHSRDDEREADQLGLEFLVEAGHSPVGYVTFFEKLAEQPTPPVILSTHPDPGARAEEARRRLEAMPEEVRSRDVHAERFAAKLAGL